MTKQSYKKSELIRQQLLDTAEHLFAEKGYFGTSVRDITDSVEQRLASVNYHFESKENLFIEVIRRRVQPLAEARLKALDLAELDPQQPEQSCLALVKAFTFPVIDFSLHGGPGWKDYCSLIAQLAAQGSYTQNVIGKEYDAVATRFINALKLIFPNSEEFTLHACFQFMLGGILYVVCDNHRMDRLSENRFHSADIERLSLPFYQYVCGGILACTKTQ